MKRYKIGIIGCGRIAKRFVQECKLIKQVMIVAIYNTNIASAYNFCEFIGEEQIICTDSFEEFFDLIDITYIASPHRTHFDYIKKSLQSQKHVLCEKPLVLNNEEARQVFDLADREKKVLLEAIKTAYAPGYYIIKRLLQDKVIGEIVDCEASFTKLVCGDIRELNPKCDGGSMNELATYTLLPIIDFCGTDYKNIYYYSKMSEQNVDLFTRGIMIYESMLATFKVGLGVKTEGAMVISGTEGYLYVKAPWWKPTEIEIKRENQCNNEIIKCEFKGDGLCYEVQKMLSFIENPLDKEYFDATKRSIVLAQILENYRKNDKITFL